MKPVFNQITVIEERKKTTEYEGFLKEVQATGFVDDLQGTTCIERQATPFVQSGRAPEKEGASQASNKVLVGDKHGQITLFDASRKLTLDRKQVFEGHPRLILSITTSTVVWIDTRLTYAAVVGRASPVIKILVFKDNENKLHHLYNLNVCPTLANPDSLEANPDQSYLELPSEVLLSPDCQFLTVTSFNGDVRLIKMPSIINPVREGDEPVNATPIQPPPGGKGQPAPAQTIAPPSGAQEEKPIVLKPEIDAIPLQTLELA